MDDFLTSGTPQILKVIVEKNRFNPEERDIKYIFVGEHTKETMVLLHKLERSMPLTKEEETQLNNIIPYWKTKFGDIENYKLKFITQIIQPNCITKHLILYLLDLENKNHMQQTKRELPKDAWKCILYSYPRVIKYTDLWELAAYLIFKLGDKQFGVKMKEIKALCKDLNCGDVSVLDSIDDSHTVSMEELIANKTFQDYYKTVPYLHCSRPYFNKELEVGKLYREFYTFESINIFNAVSDKKVLYNMAFEDQQLFLSTDDTRLEDIIDYTNTSTNNTIYMFLSDDILEHVKTIEKETNKTYTNCRVYLNGLFTKFTTITDEAVLLNERNFNIYLQTGILNDKSERKLAEHIKENRISKALMTTIINEPIINIIHMEQKNFVWSGYDLGIHIKLDLANIFKDIQPSNYLPLIKYVADGEVQLYNIYKPFFRNIDDKVKLVYLAGKDQILSLNENINTVYDRLSVKRLKYLVNLDYLVFKWRLDEQNIMNIYLFESGFIICEFHTPTGYINFDKTIDLSGITNNILGKIKDKYKLNLDLPSLNPEKLIKQTSGQLVNCNLININYKVGFNLANKLVSGYKSWDQLFNSSSSAGGNILSKFIEKLKEQHNIIVLPGTFAERIKFIYTNTYGFYSHDNIKHYIRSYMTKKDNKLTKADRETLLVNIKKVFNIDSQTINILIEELETVNLQTKHGLLFHVNCELELNKTDKYLNLLINCSNMNGYDLVKNILNLVDGLLKDCIFDTEFVVKERIGKEDDFKKEEQTAKEKGAKGKAIDLADLENLDLADLENLDLADFGELEVADVPMDTFDIDMEIVNKLQRIEDEKDIAKADELIQKEEAEQQPLQDIKLKQLVGKKEKMSVANYMKDMRRRFDQELFEPTVKGKKTNFVYESSCPKTAMRQPFIITKEKLQEIERDDPESITGYLKYRGNYYICPRIWDARAEKPISARRFIANGLKSPYTGGVSILDGPTKNQITDKYNVIIRQPTTDKYWSDPTKNKDWPAELKRTEKDAYPALSYSNKHPNKCTPCCGVNKPEDYDPNKQELQQFMKPFNYQNCNYKAEAADTITSQEETEASVGSYCKADDYISNGSTTLKNCRLGLLPEELNLLLNNNQELFLNPAETGLNDGANLFLRRGVQYNNITTVLESFANILEMKTEKLISLIINKLTPLDFIGLNNGALVNIFANSAELPVSPGEHERFRTFLNLYGNLLEYLNIDGEHIIDVLESKSFEFISQAKLLYKICTAFYNYLGYLNSPNESKNIEYVIDLFAKPRKWLPFKLGLNIIIFNKAISQMHCLDTFNYKTKQIVIFIEEEPDTFVPVVHVVNKFGKSAVSGIIELDESLNLSNALVSQLYKQKPTLTKLIESSKDRLNNIIKLLYIQSGLCNYNLTKFTSKVEKVIKLNRLHSVAQYQGIGSAAQVEYINIDNQLILPVYPSNLIKGASPYDYTKMHVDILQHNITYDVYINRLYEDLTFFMDYGYKVYEIILDKIDNEVYVCGVSFMNGLSVSVKPTLFKQDEFGALRMKIYNEYGITMKTKQQYTLNLLKIKEEHIIDKSVTESIFNLLDIYNEIIKNNLSHYISQNGKDVDVIELISCLDTRENKSIYSLLEHLHNILQKKIVHVSKMPFKDFIKSIVDAGITKTNKEKTRKLVSTICQEQKTKKQNLTSIHPDKYQLCMHGDKEQGGKHGIPRVNIPDEMYPYLLLAVANDLLNNHIDSDKIIKGKYIIPVNDMFLTRIGMGVLNISNVATTNLIISSDELSFYLSKNIISKYKKNYKLDIDSLELKIISSMSESELQNLKAFVFKDINQKLTSALGLVSILSSYDSSSSRLSSIEDKENQIITTPFNSSGILNPAAEYGVCKFPFRDKKGKINYKCSKSKDVFKTLDDKHMDGNEFICPVSLNKDKTVKTWGYCPEKPNISKQRLLQAPVVDAFDPEKPEVKIGTCSFPFIYHNKKVVNPLTGTKPLIKLSFGCEDKTNGTWCYTRPTETNKTPLIGAVDINNVYRGSWSMEPLMNGDKYGPVNLTAKQMDTLEDSMNYKEGMCSFKTDIGEQEKIEKQLELEGVKEIQSLDEYNPDYCEFSEGKRGYKKETLYLFGKNILNIPYKLMLNKNNKILTKPELCVMFNNKIRDIKKAQLQLSQTDIDYTQVYTKEPELCNEGPSRGGYKLTELRDMAITFFGLSEKEAYPMSKEGLCNYIIPIITGKKAIEVSSTISGAESGTEEKHKYIDPDDIYPANKNINLCSKPIKRDGLALKDVKAIARRYFGIDTNMPKEELCELIKEGIEKIKAENALLDREEKQLITRKDAPAESIIEKKVDLLKEMGVPELSDTDKS